MRKIAIIASILLVLFVSCTDKNVYYSISGSGVTSGDTLYLYGLDRRYEHMDTILADKNGNFEYRICADTIFPLSLLMPTGEALVLYAEPTIETTITPDSTQQDKWRINGGNIQHMYDSMVARIEQLPSTRHFEEIDSFVRHNPMNEANIMLLRRYIVETPSPINKNIRNILNRLGDKLNDNDYIKSIQEFIDNKRPTASFVQSSVPSFESTLIDGSTKVSNTRYKGKFLIINFWASWDSVSCEHLKRMSNLSNNYSPDTLTMLNISLDHDTALWRQRVLSDTILGDNVCDLKIWENTLVKKYGISKLPYSILVNPQLLNIEFNTTPERLNASLSSTIEAYKKEKEKNNKRKKNKR